MKASKLIVFGMFCLILTSCAMAPPEPNNIVRKHYGSWEKDIGYAQVVQVGKTLYISGITSNGESMTEQVKGVYQRIESILNDYGTDTSRIVKEVVYTRDMEALKASIELRKSFFAEEQYPSSSWIQIDRLFLEEFMLEVEVEALLP